MRFCIRSVIMLCSSYSHTVTHNIRRSQALPCRCGARLAVCRWRFPPPAAWRWRRWAEPAAGHGWCDWRWACTAPARQTGDTPRSPTRPSRYRRAACSETRKRHAFIKHNQPPAEPINVSRVRIHLCSQEMILKNSSFFQTIISVHFRNNGDTLQYRPLVNALTDHFRQLWISNNK